jgi:hypothetical protein
VNPAQNATAVDAEIPPAEASAAVEDKAGAIGSERHDFGAHQIGKSENGGSLDVEAAPVVLVPGSQRHARLTGGEVDPGAPELGRTKLDTSIYRI